MSIPLGHLKAAPVVLTHSIRSPIPVLISYHYKKTAGSQFQSMLLVNQVLNLHTHAE